MSCYKYSVGDAIQPCILIVGTVSKPLEILVYFDGIKYTFFSPIKALDICFKIFHVFNIEYPIQSFYVWIFVQKTFYNIVNNYDKSCLLVNQVINEIKFLNCTAKLQFYMILKYFIKMYFINFIKYIIFYIV